MPEDKVQPSIASMGASMGASMDASMGGSHDLEASVEAWVTVLFADIKGYTRLTKRVSQDTLQSLLGEYITRMTSVIRRNHGTIDKIMGDGILALFGAPKPLSSHPYSAVMAALEMQETIQALRPRWVEVRPGLDLEVRIGVATDVVLMQTLAELGDRGFMALGEGVNLASRLQDKAQPGTILISGPTYEQLKGAVPCEPVRGLELKGFEDAYTAYQVTGWPDGKETPADRVTPESEPRDERRRHTRRPIRLEVRYRSSKGQEVGSTVNVSEGGVYIETDNPLPIGSEILIEGLTSTSRGTVPITFTARVMRHGYESEPTGMGLQFLSVTATDPESIQYFVGNAYQLPAVDRGLFDPVTGGFSLDLEELFGHPKVGGIPLRVSLEDIASGDGKYLNKRLCHEFDRTRRYGHEFSCVALRLEGLLRLGDIGLISEAVLQAGKALEETVRTTDEVFYLNDGMFFVLAPETMFERVSTLAQRLVECVRRTGIRDPRFKSLRVSASSFSYDGENADDALDVLQRTMREL